MVCTLEKVSAAESLSVEARRWRTLRLSVLEGGMAAVMVGVSESYLGALAVQLGHKDTALALLITIPIFIGSLAQLGSSTLVGLLGTRRRIVVVGAGTQALVHLAFLAIALFEVRSFWLLLTAKVFYWASGLGISPAWNSWMGSLTSSIDRGRYFAVRSAVIQAVLLVAYASAGVALEHGRSTDSLLSTFGLLYTVACVARLSSTLALARQDDPLPDRERHKEPLLPRLVDAVRRSSLRVPVFHGLFHCAACVGIPFFTPHMLRVLELDFVAFMALMATATLTKAVTFPLWGRLAERTGLAPMLFASTIGTAFVALLWADTSTYRWLVCIQALSGASWAALEFAGFQLLLRSSSEEDRVAFFALSTSFTSMMQLVGSIVGSTLLAVVGAGYEVAFLASGVLRGLSALLLLSSVVAGLSRGPLPKVFFRIISMRPDGGTVRTPIVSDDD